jgi:3-hydroxybutyryl-CoA dehydratase
MLPVEFVFSAITIGDMASFEVVVTEKLVRSFAEISGDQNPLHTDTEYASTTVFNEPIPHGMLLGSFFSRLIGMHLPGKYSLYVSQTLRFHAPAPLPCQLVVEGKVLQKVESAKLVKLETKILSEDKSRIYVSGEALVKLLK